MAPLQIWITARVIDGVIAIAGQDSQTAADWQRLLLPLALFIVIWIAGQVAGELNSETREFLVERVADYNRRVIFGKAATLDIAFFESPGFHDLFTTAKDEAGRIPKSDFSVHTG
ncbi:MAG: hypothetical protein U0670_08750 [Anaerolineae bacterium]